jgi:hypothetical protein
LVLRERRLCKFDFSLGLARHGMTAVGRCKMQARFQLTFCPGIFQCESCHSPATFPLSSPRVSYLAHLHAWRCFGIAQSSQPDLAQEKKLVPQLSGNNHQSTCQELSCQFATASFFAPNSVASVQNRVMHLILCSLSSS